MSDVISEAMIDCVLCRDGDADHVCAHHRPLFEAIHLLKLDRDLVMGQRDSARTSLNVERAEHVSTKAVLHSVMIELGRERAALATARAEAAAAKRELEGLRAQMAYDFAAVIDSWAAQLDAGVPHVAAEMKATARVNRLYYGHSDPSDNPPAALLASPEARDAGEGGEVDRG